MENKQLDVFGQIMDGVIRENEIAVLIEMPEGTMETTLKDNLHLGPVLQFYVLLHALEAVFRDMCQVTDVDPEKKEELIDSLLALVRADLMGAGEAQG